MEWKNSLNRLAGKEGRKEGRREVVVSSIVVSGRSHNDVPGMEKIIKVRSSYGGFCGKDIGEIRGQVAFLEIYAVMGACPGPALSPFIAVAQGLFTKSDILI
jgi:hypothetical protein